VGAFVPRQRRYGCTSQEARAKHGKITHNTNLRRPVTRRARLIEISDKIARLSEAGYAFETKRRKLEHQFEVTNSELREEYLTAVLEIHASEANGNQHAYPS
jgi:hypothetical protein